MKLPMDQNRQCISNRNRQVIGWLRKYYPVSNLLNMSEIWFCTLRFFPNGDIFSTLKNFTPLNQVYLDLSYCYFMDKSRSLKLWSNKARDCPLSAAVLLHSPAPGLLYTGEGQKSGFIINHYLSLSYFFPIQTIAWYFPKRGRKNK